MNRPAMMKNAGTWNELTTLGRKGIVFAFMECPVMMAIMAIALAESMALKRVPLLKERVWFIKMLVD